MFHKDQLEVTARALDYLLAHADLSQAEREDAALAARYIGDLICGNTIAVYWTIEDVQALQDEDDLPENEPITDEEARQVLQTVDANHDATRGITWDVLRDSLNSVREANKEQS